MPLASFCLFILFCWYFVFDLLRSKASYHFLAKKAKKSISYSKYTSLKFYLAFLHHVVCSKLNIINSTNTGKADCEVWFLHHSLSIRSFPFFTVLIFNHRSTGTNVMSETNHPPSATAFRTRIEESHDETDITEGTHACIDYVSTTKMAICCSRARRTTSRPVMPDTGSA